MGLKGRRRRPNLDKPFLLVFHGGLVGYLLIHNLAIPLVQNWGRGVPLWHGLQYFFIPQAILWCCFLNTRLNRQNGGFAPLAVALNLSWWALSCLLFGWQLGDGITTHLVSSGISLVAIACFWAGFFGHFQKFFRWRFPGHRWQYTVVVGLGLAASALQHRLSATPANAKAPPAAPARPAIESRVALTLRLPSSDFGPNEVVIESSGFAEAHLLRPADLASSIWLVNRSRNKHLIRLERARRGRWSFKRVIPIKASERLRLPLDGQGLYKLHSPSSKHLGQHFLIQGSENFAVGTYVLDNKGVEVH